MVILFLLSCDKKDRIDNPEQYSLIEKQISIDCNAFKMLFNKGDYLFVYSISGRCENITNEIYLQEYKEFLCQYKNHFINKKGYIILNYTEFYNNKKMIREVINITNKEINKNIILSELDESGITLYVR